MRISSSITLMLKFLVPLFWGVMFTSFAIMLWVLESDHYLFSKQSFKLGTTLFTILGLVIFYFTLFSLKRVEVDNKGYFITNYFKTFHFPFEMIDCIRRRSFLFGFGVVTIKFVRKTSFGKSIFFITSRKRYNEYLELYKEYLEPIN